jgi:hypothetical protein
MRWRLRSMGMLMGGCEDWMRGDGGSRLGHEAKVLFVVSCLHSYPDAR